MEPGVHLWTRRLAGLVCIVPGLLACSGPTQTVGEPRTLRVAVASDVVTLDPHLHDELTTGSVLGNLFEGLVGFDSEMRVEPLLAERWESPTDLTWRFHLRSGISFHDGRPLTAEDVRFSLERARNHPRSRVAGTLVAVQRVEVIDPGTLDVATSRPYPVLLNKLVAVSVVPQDSPEEITEPVGTGPYAFVDRETGRRVSLEAVASYWGDSATWPSVEVEVVSDEMERIEALVEGRYDLVTTLTPLPAARLSSLPDVQLVARHGLDTRILGVNFAQPYLAEPRVRRAMDLAVDRRSIIQDILAGQAEPSGQLVSPNVFGYDAEIHPTEYDPAAARQLLTEVSLEPVELSLLHPPGRQPEAAAIAESLSDAGLTVRAVQMPWSEIYRNLVAGDYDLFLARYECSSGDASDVLDAAIHSQDAERGYGTANYLSFSSPDLDLVIEQAGRTLHGPARRQLLAQGLRMASHERPFIALWHDLSLYGKRAGLGWTPRLDGRVLFGEIDRQ